MYPLEPNCSRDFWLWKRDAQKMALRLTQIHGPQESLAYTQWIWNSIHPWIKNRCNLINPVECPDMTLDTFLGHITRCVNQLQPRELNRFRKDFQDSKGYFPTHSMDRKKKIEKRPEENGYNGGHNFKPGRTSPPAGSQYDQGTNSMSSDGRKSSPPPLPGRNLKPCRSPPTANDRGSTGLCERCHAA